MHVKPVSLITMVGLVATSAFAAGLLDNVPDPAGEKAAGWENIQGGGEHSHYVAGIAAQAAVNQYKSALEADGWSIVSANAGGSSYGSNGHVIASSGDRYLVMVANGPSQTAYIDLCVWPNKPENSDC